MAQRQDTSDASTVAVAAVKPVAKPKPRKLPPYNVVLLDDDDHSYPYVIRMLGALFAFAPEKAMQVAKEVDTTGRAILMTTHRELAELKRDQIRSFGADELVASCAGPMTAVIEPAT